MGVRAVAQRVFALAALVQGTVALGEPPVHTQEAVAGSTGQIEAKARKTRDSWWAYVPLSAAAPPSVKDEQWCTTDIDRYVLAGLEARGIPAPAEADRRTLIRRASFDLTGLPPTPEEVEAFVADTAPGAWERLVDRLLSSPHYGERWGRHWLDLVRYADTNGFERDSDKPAAWKYRDWVVSALNADTPYDRFVLEQLAGDELSDRTYDSLRATGYYRLGMWDDEVPDLAQALADDMDGIVDTTARTFLGISLGCARCHDHKGDPIAQREYYAFAAYFAGVAQHKTSPFASLAAEHVLRLVRTDFGKADPEADRRTFAARRDAIVSELRALERAAGIHGAGASPSGTEPGWTDRAPSSGLAAHLAFEDERSDRAQDSAGGESARVRDAGFGADGRSGRAFRFDGGDDRVDLPNPVADDFTVSFWFRTTDVGGGSETDRRWFLGKGLVDGEIPGIVRDWGVSLIGNGFVAAGTGDPETFVSSGPGHNDGAWHHVAFTRSRASGAIELWVDGARVDAAAGSREPLDAPKTIAIGTLKPDVHAFSGTIDEVRIYRRVLEPGEIRATAFGIGTGPVTAAAVAKALGDEAASRWEALQGALAALTPPQWAGETVLAVREVKTPRVTQVMQRGSPHALGEEVLPAVPTVAGRIEPGPAVPPAHGESSGRRLALARWIASPDNALALRTAANRIWQHHFGMPIAPTPNDFGKLGEQPTHPELLDHLASELVRRGWSLKAMHRYVMASRAYRMSSVPDPRALERDPDGSMLSRFRMRRLSSEELRDAMLAAAGTLNPEVGGPGVRPPMPPEVLATSSKPAEVWPLTGEASWTRRSLYIHLKRSLQHPLLQVFDSADVDSPCPVRFSTVQPTQALSMLNGALTIGTARDLASRLEHDRPGDLRAQLARGRTLVSGREPAPEEIDEAAAFVAELESRDGMSRHQALSAYALVLLNLNEFLYID